jgi:hypothetical protein
MKYRRSVSPAPGNSTIASHELMTIRIGDKCGATLKGSRLHGNALLGTLVPRLGDDIVVGPEVRHRECRHPVQGEFGGNEHFAGIAHLLARVVLSHRRSRLYFARALGMSYSTVMTLPRPLSRQRYILRKLPRRLLTSEFVGMQLSDAPAPLRLGFFLQAGAGRV